MSTVPCAVGGSGIYSGQLSALISVLLEHTPRLPVAERRICNGDRNSTRITAFSAA